MYYKYDPKYFLTQLFVNRIFRLNFRKLIITGKENIPAGKPIIYAPTHRNALVDALILVHENVKQQVVFLARADIFKKDWVVKILDFLRIMPVYRLRDGKENLSKNQEIFENCRTILQARNPLCLFPEAKYNPHQNLLPLQKAIPRIALPTEALEDFSLDTHIVPIAFYYLSKDSFLSDLYVTYGVPIKVSAYKELYQKDENQALNRLRLDLDARLRESVVDIPEENYNEIAVLIDVNAQSLVAKSYPEKDGLIPASQEIVRQMNRLKSENPDDYLDKIRSIRETIEILKKHNLTTKDPISTPVNHIQILGRFLSLVLTLPIAFVGLLNTIFPILIYRKVLGMFKDKQFISSLRIVVGIFIVPLFYLIQAFVLGLVVYSFPLGLLYLIASPIVFYFGAYWRKWWKETIQMDKVRLFKKNNFDLWDEVKSVLNLPK
ncbi:MAG: 1-acyl-sn-glycerol-3-phosphate acyltransferase [Paludibacteraceae bacterium]